VVLVYLKEEGGPTSDSSSLLLLLLALLVLPSSWSLILSHSMTFTIDAKRPSGVSSSGDKFLVSSKPWGYDPDFGIVHPCGCAICRNYMLHVSEGDVDSYALAIMERDAEYRNRFLDGFRKGRAAQLEHDTERLSSYRSERNLAREQVAVYEINVQEVEKEVLRLKDELLALRIAYNEVCLYYTCGSLLLAKVCGI
jgi:hypothetical protein